MDKKNLILEAIIQEYLKCLEPISSKQLMDSISIKISSASIRNYFTKLSTDGALEQLHVSGGRVPTLNALAKYWLQKLDLDSVSFNSIDELSQKSYKSDIFYTLKFNSSNSLKEILNIDNRYLILVFEYNEMILEYNNVYEKLLQEFIYHDIEELILLAKNLGALQLSSLLSDFVRQQSVRYNGLSALANMSNSDEYIKYMIDAKVLDDIDRGFYFDGVVNDGFMGINTDITINNKSANLFCMGKLDCDFSYFLAS